MRIARKTLGFLGVAFAGLNFVRNARVIEGVWRGQWPRGRITGVVVQLNESAVALFCTSLPDQARTLVLGGTGWFGRTALAMLQATNPKLMVVATSERQFEVAGRQYRADAWNFSAVKEFQPEVVLDFAYAIPGRVSVQGLEEYERLNRVLEHRLQEVAALDSVRYLLTVSSGAAVFLPSSLQGSPSAQIYSRGKQRLENALRSIRDKRDIAVSIARAWSVSGGYVQRPKLYAFSGMVLECLATRKISVRSRNRIFRRYCSVEDLLSLSTAQWRLGECVVIDSGGPIVEMAELATAISSQVEGSAVLPRESDDDGPIDCYFSSDTTWDESLAKFGLNPLTLDDQIANVLSAFNESP